MEALRTSGLAITAEQQIQFDARFGDSSPDAMPRILTIAGSTAEIAIKGVLTAAPDWMAMFFGGGNTTYPEILSALAMAESDKSVKDIVLKIDSLGGQVSGLFEAVDAIALAKKPTKAVVGDLAASAAYALASQADKIVATNRAARFGSVGILATFNVVPEHVKIASTKAPKKSPDVTTAEGQEVIRETLDPLHDLFVDAIAKGRAKTPKDINANFGQGGLVLAKEALNNGMIDSIKGGQRAKTAPAKTRQAKQEASKMDLNTLKAEHPALFAEVVAIGTNAETDRISAHLIMGESSGDMKTALAAIKSGDGMTETHRATYFAAQSKAQAIGSRQQDDQEADPETPAGEATAEDQAAEEIAAQLENRFGVDEEK